MLFFVCVEVNVIVFPGLSMFTVNNLALAHCKRMYKNGTMIKDYKSLFGAGIG